MHLPPQKAVLAVIYNTIQLVDVIVETLLAQKHQPASTNHKLVVTGRDPVPVEISQGMTIRRKDLGNAEEEAGVIVMLSIVKSFTNDINISVISDDTGVFVLSAHFYHDRQLTCQVTMEATSKERKSIDIQATAPPQGYLWTITSSSSYVGMRHCGSVVGNGKNKGRENS